MFERFTERARQVVVFAQDEAGMLGSNEIGTEHILLGLLREEDGFAARILDSLEITLEEVRAQVARIDGEGGVRLIGQIPFTRRAKKVLELALREALSLGHNYIGTEHILLGLASEGEGVAAQILRDFGAVDEKIRAETMRLLGGVVYPGVSGVVSSETIMGRVGGNPQQLRISCPKCGAVIEMVSIDAENTRFEVSAEGDRTCPGCGQHWAISYNVSWQEVPEPDET